MHSPRPSCSAIQLTHTDNHAFSSHFMKSDTDPIWLTSRGLLEPVTIHMVNDLLLNHMVTRSPITVFPFPLGDPFPQSGMELHGDPVLRLVSQRS